MRFAVCGYSHETNTFSTVKVTSKLLDSRRYPYEVLRKANEGVRTDAGGYIDACKDLGIDLEFGMMFMLTPCGPTERDAFEKVRGEFLDWLTQLHKKAPLDGIILKMHGAGVADGYDDLEGELLQVVRERFGPDMIIGTSLDLHGNITEKMVENADVLVGYKCYPHVDGYECGYKTVELMHKLITQGKRYAKRLIKLPLVLAPAYGLTLQGTAQQVQSLLYGMLEEEKDLADLSFFHGFVYADIPHTCASVVALAEDQETADRCAKKLAEYAWSVRYDYKIPTHSAQEAVDLALEAEGPVVINESSDNTGGGAPGDGTHLLREMLRRNIPGSAFGYIYDPEVVSQAMAAGVGARINCMLGGKVDNLHGATLELKDAYVKALNDGIYTCKSPMGLGGRVNLGKVALLVVENVHIIVCSVATQPKDDGPFMLAGLDWQQLRILALKSSQHFKAWWAPRVKTIVSCDSPGIHSADLDSFDYKNINKTYFPFADPQWSAE